MLKLRLITYLIVFFSTYTFAQQPDEIIGKYHLPNKLDIEIFKNNNYSVAIVILSTLFDEEEKLSGSSIFIDERNLSLVKATLDAVNRRIKLL